MLFEFLLESIISIISTRVLFKLGGYGAHTILSQIHRERVSVRRLFKILTALIINISVYYNA